MSVDASNTDTPSAPVISVSNNDDTQAAKAALEASKAALAEAKKIAFDREVRALIKQASDTIISKYPDEDVREFNPPVELVTLNRYNTIYGNTSPTEHYKYFETIYNRKRMEIITCLKDDASKGERHIDDRWLCAGKLVVQFGEGIKAASRELDEKRKQVQIKLSDIYNIACELQKQAEEFIGETGANADSGGKDLIRTNILMLHLMRIFYHLNEGADKKQIGEIVTFLEAELGVSKRTVTTAAADVAKQAATGPATGGGLSSLFTMSLSMMEKFGYKPPAGLVPPSEEDITKVISNVFSNEATQNALQSVFTGLNGTKDFGTAIQKAVAGVTDPKTMEAIQSSVMNTAQEALNRPGQGTAPTSAPSAPQNFEAAYKD
jgi:hypothetical protein